MSTPLRFILVGLLSSTALLASAQPGTIDTTFDAGGADYSDFFVSAAAVQPDGKIMVVAYGTDANGISQPSQLMRLNSDGSVDLVFNAGSSTYWARAMELRPDGGVLVAGFDKIRQYTADGNCDPLFAPALGTVDNIAGIALQPDGKLLVIAGNCPGSFGGSANMRLTRLLADGSQDPDFNTPIRSTNGLCTVKALADGRILVGGSICYNDGNNFVSRGLCRLMPDGSLDPTFDAEPQWIEGPGSAYTGCALPLANGGVISGITTLSVTLPDGSPDPAFAPVHVTGPWDPWVRAIVEQEDGRIIIAGRFTACNGIDQERIARLNSDGSIDDTFTGAIGDNGFSTEVERLLLQPDGKVLVGGYFTAVDGENVKSFLRLNTCPTGIVCGDFTTNVTAAPNQPGSMELFPVPYQDGVMTVASDALRSSAPAFVSIRGLDGRTVMNEQQATDRRDGAVSFAPASALVPGVYVLHVRSAGWEASRRFVKQ